MKKPQETNINVQTCKLQNIDQHNIAVVAIVNSRKLRISKPEFPLRMATANIPMHFDGQFNVTYQKEWLPEFLTQDLSTKSDSETRAHNSSSSNTPP